MPFTVRDQSGPNNVAAAANVVSENAARKYFETKDVT